MLKILDLLLTMVLITGNVGFIISNLDLAEDNNIWILILNGFVVVVLSVLLYQKLKKHRKTTS